MPKEAIQAFIFVAGCMLFAALFVKLLFILG